MTIHQQQTSTAQWTIHWYENEPNGGAIEGNFANATITQIDRAPNYDAFAVHIHTYDGTTNQYYHATVPSLHIAKQFVQLVMKQLAGRE